MRVKEKNYFKGREGEERARLFLEKKGYELVEANYKNKIGEIDLIMRKGEWLVFVEVKYKSDDSLGLPEEMIDKRKIGQVKRTAEGYVFLTRPKEKKYRIDAVCILDEEIKHYENLE